MWLDDLDRRLGAAARRRLRRVPGGRALAWLAANALGPSFRTLVAALLLTAGRRRTGVEALAGSAIASWSARLLRDRLGRPRPGRRSEGGFPSRHAAAAVAITRAVGRGDRSAGRLLAAAAALGLAGRVASAEHDPADVVAGAALGWAVARVVALGLERMAPAAIR
jgi:membrane-associated phospholipid phosphatase